jgi:hypothetical protein
LQQHELLAAYFDGIYNISADTEVPFAWMHHMTIECIRSTIDFIVLTRKTYSSFPDWPAYPDMTHSWGQVDIAPSRKKVLCQYKRLNLRINDDNNTSGSMLCRVANSVAEGMRPVAGSKKDIPVTGIEWRRLVKILENSSNICYADDVHDLVFVHPYAGNRRVVIRGDEQLRYALKVLRSQGKVEVVVAFTPKR